MTQNKWCWIWPQCVPNAPAWPGYTIDIKWLKENGWGCVFETMYYFFQPAESPQSALFDYLTETAFQLCAENDVPVTLILSDIFAIGTATTPTIQGTRALPSSFYDQYNWLFSYMEGRWGPNGTDGQVLTGYWFEATCDSAVEWLRGVTDLDIRQSIYGGMWQQAGKNTGDTCYIGNGNESQASAIDRRVSMVDGVDIELWCVGEVYGYDMVGCASYLNEVGISIGINSSPYSGPQSDPDGRSSWRIICGTGNLDIEPIAPIAIQTRRFLQGIWEVKQRVGAFNAINAQTSNDNDTLLCTDVTDPTWWQLQQSQLELWDALRLTQQTPQINLTNMAYVT